ncbi:aminotransferase class I/II-fold pyridoxal phosphate-dependent enzyme [Streptomyces sp. NPDC041003]|uniref:aminotransferase class I/II-fold pyridoxal phosphate-dependent enzyme n=1 Tax=Streptomyces sp. NPDC041003 TaxID=3155730 RepID=UPI0033DE264D
MKASSRLHTGDGYLFDYIDKLRAGPTGGAVAPIPLGVGDCDLPRPPLIVAAMQQAVQQPELHRYPPYEGTPDMRGGAAAGFFQRRFGLRPDPHRQVLVTLGSKEAMAHLALAYVDPGDVVIVPDPGCPVYAIWARFCGAEVYRMPLRRENGFLPDLDAIPADIAHRAKLLWVCYPNNPTAALASPRQPPAGHPRRAGCEKPGREAAKASPVSSSMTVRFMEATRAVAIRRPRWAADP